MSDDHANSQRPADATDATDATDASSPSLWISPGRVSRILLVTAAAICGLIVWNVAKFIDVPVHRGFQVSLMQQPNPALAVLGTMIALAAAVLAGAAIASRVRFSAGILVATVGLAVMSLRGGSSRYVWLWADDHTGRWVFVLQALEVILLYSVILAGWFWLLRLHRTGKLKAPELRWNATKESEARPYRMTAVAIHIVATSLAMLLLMGPSADAKSQVMVGTALSAMVGAAVATYYRPASRMGGPFLVGTLVVAVVGYLTAFVTSQGLSSGNLQGLLAALARPLPLDYAGMGVAGTLLGYFIGGPTVHSVMEVAESVTFGLLPVSSRWPVSKSH